MASMMMRGRVRRAGGEAPPGDAWPYPTGFTDT